MSLTRNQFSFYLFYFACLACAAGLPLSKVLISNSLFIMAAAWLMQEDLLTKWKSFLSNRVALILTSFYLLHLIGLFWTSDFKTAANDLRVKLPILLFPLFLSSGPALSRKQIIIILEVFAAAVLVSVLCSFGVYAGIIKRAIHDIRDISLFVSHIRLSLMICIAIVYHLIRIQKDKATIRLYRLFSIAAGLTFFALTGSLTGFIILFVTGVILLIRYVSSHSIIYKAITLFTILALILFIGGFIGKEIRSFYSFKEEDVSNLESHTIHGHPYTHFIDHQDREDGRLVYIYISWDELQSEWENRSTLNFEGKDRKGQDLKYTLVRYMTALGLRKDAEGFDKLSEEDITNVENGITNPIYKNYGLKVRIHQVIWEIDNYIRGNDPSGHSVSMRFEFWKNGMHLFEEAPVFGVGTGDVKTELNKMYDARRSPLPEKWRLRPHNQYLTFAITFGVIGLIWFLLTFFYPLILNRNILYLSFTIIIGLSMLTEDTLETQQGVSLYAFLNSFLIFKCNRFDKEDAKD